MHRQILLAVAIVATGVVAASCADQSTAPAASAARIGAPSDASAAQKVPPGLAKPGRAALLTNVPVTGTLSDGGTFAGTFTATHLDYDQTAKTLVLTGDLTGTATSAAGVATAVTQHFTTPITLRRNSASAMASIYHQTQATTCSILFLDLGPLHLDLLGLTVDLNEVVLAVNAVAGPGALLGNLLCAVVNLLDISGTIAAITNLLGQINAILSGLSLPGAAGTGASLVTPGLLAPAGQYVISA